MPSPAHTPARNRDNSQGEERAARPGRDRALSEYGEIIQDIARGPRRSPLTWFKLKIAGQA